MTDGNQVNNPEQYYATHRYSIIPDIHGGVHAVLDGMVRSVCHSGTWEQGLPALCGTPVHPAKRLPVAARLCADCELKVTTFCGMLIPRPAPGNPLLKEMAALYPGGAR